MKRVLRIRIHCLNIEQIIRKIFKRSTHPLQRHLRIRLLERIQRLQRVPVFLHEDVEQCERSHSGNGTSEN